jgi:hypothetical protein
VCFLLMTLRPDQKNYIEAIVAGLPHLAEAVSAIPPEYQARALEAAGGSYLKTFRRLGLSEPESQTWASSVMRRLRRHVTEMESTKKEKLTKLYEHLEADQ